MEIKKINDLTEDEFFDFYDFVENNLIYLFEYDDGGKYFKGTTFRKFFEDVKEWFCMEHTDYYESTEYLYIDYIRHLLKEPLNISGYLFENLIDSAIDFYFKEDNEYFIKFADKIEDLESICDKQIKAYVLYNLNKIIADDTGSYPEKNTIEIILKNYIEEEKISENLPQKILNYRKEEKHEIFDPYKSIDQYSDWKRGD